MKNKEGIMKELRITLCDGAELDNYDEHAVIIALSKKYKLVVDNSSPDIAICDMWGVKHMDIAVPKIFMTCEPYIDKNDFYDVYIGGREFESKKMQFNLITYGKYFKQLQENKYYTDIKKIRETPKTKFCAFLYKNRHARHRIQFCRKLQKYKWVDCLGDVLHNTDIDESQKRFVKDWHYQQINIYKDYKFVIAFENNSYPGYVCEKIAAALYAGCVPIYWGAGNVGEYINPKAFINVNDFSSFDECIDYVKKVDNDDNLYQQYITAKPITEDSKLHNLTPEILSDKILNSVEKILQVDYVPVGHLTGTARLKAKWLNRFWKYKQSITYRIEIMCEKIGLR